MTLKGHYVIMHSATSIVRYCTVAKLYVVGCRAACRQWYRRIRRLTSPYKLSIVTMRWVIRNFECKVAAAAITHECHMNVDCSVRSSSVTITYMGRQSLWEIAFFPRPEVGSCLLDISSTVAPP